MIRNISTVYNTPFGRNKNEDTIVFNALSGIYGVFDGAGALEEDVVGLPMSGAKMASMTVAQNCSVVDRSLHDAVLRANRLLDLEQKGYNVPDDKRTRWGTTVASVKITDSEFEWVTVGDSIVIVIETDGVFHLPGGLDYDHDGDALRKLIELRAVGYTNKKEIDEILRPIHEATRNRANLDYGVVNGEKAAENFIRSGRLLLAGVSDIIMLTDGLFLPSEDPRAPHDWAAWIRLYREGGLEHVLRTVRAIQATDPDCLKYPRLKSGDDVAAVALRFVD